MAQDTPAGTPTQAKDTVSAAPVADKTPQEAALERAEGYVAPAKAAAEATSTIDRIYVTPEGAVSSTPPGSGSAVQLTGAEARAYQEAHGGAKAAAKAEDKAATKTEDKAAKAPRTAKKK